MSRYPDKAHSLFHVRNRQAGGVTFYDVPGSRLDAVWKAANSCGGQWYISAMAPTAHTIFQAEVQESATLEGPVFHVTYSFVVDTMRGAMSAQQLYADGLLPRVLLRKYLCHNSYEWLQHLLNTYPGHVVELSAYSIEWGSLPGYNTIFWEVRDY